MRDLFSNSSLNLELIFNSSTDGYTASAWHSKCDNQGDTLTIVKTTNDEVFGGYTNIPWTSTDGNGKNNHASFVFDLHNG